MRFGSVCSGIEAASVAWNPLGWKAAWLSEIEPFPCAVLAHHYPDVPNLGDMTALPERILSREVEAPDVFCGGTPCQAFSVAGLRQSLDDARGNLSLTFCEIANAIDTVRADRGEQPAIIFWENVPGVLSTKDNAFGCFLAGLVGEDLPLLPPGGKWTNAGCVLGPKRAVAWRVLDAQYFGVAQRRRRVFVVASARKGFDPAAVLFEFDGVRRDTAPSREAGKVAPTIPSRSTACGGLGTDFDCDGGLVQAYGGNNQSGPIDVATARNACASASGRMDFETETSLVQPAHTLRGEGFDASEDGTGRGTPLVPVSFAIQAGALRINPASGPDGIGVQADHAYTLEARAEVQAIAFPANLSGTQFASTENLSPALGAMNPTAVAFSCKDYGSDAANDIAPTMRAMGHTGSHPNAGGQLAVAIQDVRGTDKAQNGRGWNDDGTAYTLDTHATQEVAYSECEALHNKGFVTLKEGNASTQETYPGTLLRTLLQEVGEEAFTKWGLGILNSLQSPEILRQALHGFSIRSAAFSRSWVVYCALSRQKDGSGWLLQSLRETGCEGCPPQGWKPPEQFAGELGAYLSELSQPGAQASRFMRDLWRAAQGSGLLREALSAVQEMGRSSNGESQSAYGTMQVRRLTCEEAEFLQGFPRGYTAIPWRKKTASECPDGPRYKALGNSWAVPNVAWIGRRIQNELNKAI